MMTRRCGQIGRGGVIEKIPNLMERSLNNEPVDFEDRCLPNSIPTEESIENNITVDHVSKSLYPAGLPGSRPLK